MSTQTWITEKELEWEREWEISLEEKHENFIAQIVKIWEMLATTEVKMSGSECAARARFLFAN